MAYPQVVVAPSAAKRIRHHDCWVFRDELAAPPPPLPGGESVELIDPHGAFLAYAFYSPSSHIAARVVSTDRQQPVDRSLFGRKIQAAIARRRGLTGTDARRLIFSEADGLPGLIVDQYGAALVLQSRTAGIERWKSTLLDLLTEQLRPAGILERSDKEFREAEDLLPVTQLLAGAVPERIRIQEDGLSFLVDPYRGHKTGFYLDQRETRRRLRDCIQPGERVADVCAYTGAFSLVAASRGAKAVWVEQEESLLPLAKEQAELNRAGDALEWVVADAFYWLEAKANGHERFDWVILDPPGLAKTKAEVLKGRQALHRLLVQGLRLLAPEGTLLLSICSYHLLGLTEEILRIAAAECGVRLRMRGITLQASDHPWILQMAPTRYLMSWMAQRDG